MRRDPRDPTGLRPLALEPHYLKYPAGSCFVRMGETWVLCTASIEDGVPPFLEGKKRGWITAEYSMLPGATHTRTRRDSALGRPNGRAQEIQRLIGRALRSTVNMQALGERTLLVDCDVIQADGGTRAAAINGGFVALALAVRSLQLRNLIATSPIKSAVAAVSVGIKEGEVLVDLDYSEDAHCDVDMNFVMLENDRIVEMQGTAEGSAFTAEDSQKMLARAIPSIRKILEMQKKVVAESGG